MSRIGCATTGCSSSAGAATGPTSAPSSRAFAWTTTARSPAIRCVTEQIAGRTSRPPASPPGWRRRTTTTAAPCSPPSLVDTKQLDAAPTSGRRSRLAAEANKPRAARQAAVLLGSPVATSVGEIFDGPARYLGKKASTATRVDAELATLALTRLAASDSESVAGMLVDRWEKALPPDLAAWAWASVARQTAMKLQPAGGRPVPARRAASTARARSSSCPTTCSPGKCARPCAPTAASRAGSRWCRRSTRCRRPSRRTRPGSTGRRAPCRRWPRIRRTAKRLKTSSQELADRHRRRSSTSTASSPPKTSASRRRCRPSRRR